MKRLTVRVIAALAIVSFNAMGIVIRHDVSDSHYQASPADFPPLATLYQVGAHGTLIAPQWVVTAAHTIFCVEPGDKVKVGYQLAEVEARYSHGDYQRGGDNDIALIKLKEPIASVTPADIYRKNDEEGQKIWFIGSGGTGNGNVGQSVSYKQNNGRLRKAQNLIESASGSEIEFTFDEGDDALPLEGVSGNGDSGGPAYKLDGTSYQLLGISSRADSWFKQMGEYGVNEVYTRVSYHADWIDKVMSQEPHFLKNRTTQERFPQDEIIDRLDSICANIGFK